MLDTVIHKSTLCRKYITCSFIIATFLFILLGCGGINKTEKENNGENTESVAADSVTLTWEAPMFNVDGSELNDLAGYKLYYGTFSGNYTAYVDAGNSMSVEIADITRGIMYCFTVTAYDTSGNESNYSNEICTEIPI